MVTVFWEPIEKCRSIRNFISNPEQFGGGAYIAICTPEIGNDTEYGPQTLECLGNNPTATGKSAGIRLVNFRYKDGFHSGGGTASISDSATLSAVRSNVAVFSFATNNDLGSVSVFNGFQWSEQFNNSFWSQPTLPASLTAVNEFTPFGATTGVFQFTGADSPTVNYFSQTKRYCRSNLYIFSFCKSNNRRNINFTMWRRQQQFWYCV